MNLEFTFNRVNLPSELFEDTLPNLYNLTKANILIRKLYEISEKESMYVLKNPSIGCFNEEYYIPVPHSYRSYGYETYAYFFFKNGILSKLTFEVIHNKTIAIYMMRQFRDFCVEKFEMPNEYRGRVRGSLRTALWEDEENILVSELSANGENSYVHFYYKKS